MMTPCMGGWCRRREACAHYHAEGDDPVERLCAAGLDEPVPLQRAQKIGPSDPRWWQSIRKTSEARA